MNNTALQAMITEFGDRIFAIIIDNNVKIFIGYQSSNIDTASKLQFKTVGGTDLFGVETPAANEAHRKKGVKCMMWYPTAIVQAIGVMDEDAVDLRMDPFQFG